MMCKLKLKLTIIRCSYFEIIIYILLYVYKLSLYTLQKIVKITILLFSTVARI